MSYMPDMTPTSSVAAVVSLTSKFIKNASVCLKKKKIYYKIVYYTLCFGSVNCQKSRWKVKFTKSREVWHLG